MQTIAWLLFESRYVLLAVLFLVNFFLLVHWRRGGRVRPLLISLCASVLILTANTVVVTQREHAAAIMKRVERAILSADTDALGRELAVDFEAGSMDRVEFLDFVRVQLQRVAVRTVGQTGFDVKAGTPSRFEADLSYAATVASQQYSGLVPSAWRITFRKAGSTWKIAGIEPISVGRQQVPSWRDLP